MIKYYPYVHETKCMCENYGQDHSVKFHFWNDGVEDSEFTISTGLNHYRGFWDRLWIGFKYALGIDNTHYFYTEQTLNKEEVLKLQAYINSVAKQFVEH